MGNKKKIKEEKASMAVYVSVVLLGFMIVLSAIYFTSISIRKSQLQTALKVKEAYETDVDRGEEIYQQQLAKLKGPNGKKLVITVNTTNHATIFAEDSLGNAVTVPGGFKIADESGETVQEGIVIEDSRGNQFVWIPVSNIDGDGSNPIKIDVTNSVEITLGRYRFAASDATDPGEPTIVQKGSEWARTNSNTNTNYKIVNQNSSSIYHYELANSSNMTYQNTTAKDLKAFITSVKENKGYYLARYEASYVSGDTFGDETTDINYKMASVVSDANAASGATGSLWRSITQPNAAKVCQNMYSAEDDENIYVESDLVNSYAYDTAIVYIQEMGNSNYANKIDNSGTLKNTGGTGDEVCKIFDIGGNLREWTTEYCTNDSKPCTYVGATSYNSSFTALKTTNSTTGVSGGIGFRALLYINDEIDNYDEVKYAEDGLIAHYDAINNTGNGHDSNTNTWKNLAGTENDGTIVGATIYNNYVSFDGQDDYVNLGQFIDKSVITLEATIKVNSIQNGEACILDNFQSGGMGIYLYNGVPRMQIYSSTEGYKSTTLGNSLTAGGIYHIVGTYDGSYVKIYVNGELIETKEATGSIGNPSNNTIMAIGTNPSGNAGASGYGNIDVYNIRIYERALAQSEIIRNYSTNKIYFGID